MSGLERVRAGLARRARAVPAPAEPVPPPLPGRWLEEYDPEAWAALRAAWEAGPALTDVDRARISYALELAHGSPELAHRLAAELRARGAAAALHASGQRDLPRRRAEHNLTEGQLRLGRIVPDPRNHPPTAAGDFGVDHDVLRTSMLVLGPPGAGKTLGFAVPVIEHLALSALANKSSLVVLDAKGEEFATAAFDGWFDVTVDAENPSCGFSLFGGAADPDEAADRLAGALLPQKASEESAAAVRNAVSCALSPLHAALGRWPTVTELVRAMRADATTVDAIAGALADHPEGARLLDLLAARRAQAAATRDPAAAALERLALLDRPALTRLFDHPARSFAMREIDAPLRVRIVLPEARYPEVARILARLTVAQFAQVATAPGGNRGIFKALVVDEAGRYVDEHVARGVQRLRSANAGLALLAHSLGDFPPAAGQAVFAATGCKAVLGGLHPADAELVSRAWGEQTRYETTVSYSETTSRGADPHGPASGTTSGRGMSVRQVEAPRWSVSDLTSDLAPGRAVVSLTRSDGRRVGPVHVDLRG